MEGEVPEAEKRYGEKIKIWNERSKKLKYLGLLGRLFFFVTPHKYADMR